MPEAITVNKVISKLASRFMPEQSVGVDATYQFLLDDAEDFFFTIQEQHLDVVNGEHSDPDITLILDSETFIRVVTGDQDGMSAFLKGQLRAEGNVMLATKLSKYFSKDKQR